jgi:hypothetical protein
MNPLNWLKNKLKRNKNNLPPNEYQHKNIISNISKVDTTKITTPSTPGSMISYATLNTVINKKYEVTYSGKVEKDSSTWSRPNNKHTKDRVDRLSGIIDTEE